MLPRAAATFGSTHNRTAAIFKLFRIVRLRRRWEREKNKRTRNRSSYAVVFSRNQMANPLSLYAPYPPSALSASLAGDLGSCVGGRKGSEPNCHSGCHRGFTHVRG